MRGLSCCPASWSWPSILVYDMICPEYPEPSSNVRLSSAGLSTRCIARMSRSMLGSTTASTDVRPPAVLVGDEPCGARVAPEVDVAR